MTLPLLFDAVFKHVKTNGTCLIARGTTSQWVHRDLAAGTIPGRRVILGIKFCLVEMDGELEFVQGTEERFRELAAKVGVVDQEAR